MSEEMLSSQTDKGVVRHHIPFGEKIAYGFGSGTEILMANLIIILALPVYNLGLGVSTTLIGVVMMVTKLFDAVSDPLMGYISDNSKLKWGRRKPFIILGGVLTGLLCVLMWRAPSGLSVTALSVYFFVIAILYYGSYTVFYVPYNALGYEMTDDYDERSRLMAWKWGIGSFVGLIILPCILPLCYRFDENNCAVGARIVGPAVALLIILFTIPPGIVPKEREVRQNKIPFIKALLSTLRSKSMLLLCGIVVFGLVGILMILSWRQYLNMAYIFEMDQKRSANMVFWFDIVYGVCNVGFMYVAGFAATRLDKKQVLIGGLVLMIVGLLGSFFYITPSAPYLQLLLAVFLAPGMSCVWVLTNSCIADVCDEDELRTGARREGFYGAVYSFSMKLGAAFGLGVGGILLGVLKFDKDLPAQLPETVMKLRIGFVVVPTILFVLAVWMAIKYPITRKRHREIQQQLKQRELSQEKM